MIDVDDKARFPVKVHLSVPRGKGPCKEHAAMQTLLRGMTGTSHVVHGPLWQEGLWATPLYRAGTTTSGPRADGLASCTERLLAACPKF